MSFMDRSHDALKTLRARLTMCLLSEPLRRLLASLMCVVAGFMCSSPAWAAVAFRSASSVNLNGSALTLTINLPAGTVGGDLMVAGIVVRPSSATITAPAGWTLQRRQNNTNPNDLSLAVYYKVAGTSEPASYAWTFSASAGSAGGISSFSGVNTTTPINVEAGATTGATQTTTFNHPGISTTIANTMVVTHYSYSSSDRFTPPGGMTEAFDVASLAVANSGGVSIAQDYVLRAATGATGTLTSTAASNADVGSMDALALAPLSCGAVINVGYAAATAQSGQAIVYWSSTNAVLVLRKASAFVGETPSNGRVYVAGDAIGGATVAFVGSAASFTQTGLANGTTYNFRVFPYTTGPGPCYATGAGSDLTARPVAAGNEAWSYMLAGGSALKSPTTGDGGTVYFSGNAGRMISLNTSNGTQSWVPAATTAAVQGYLVWTSFSAGGSFVLAGDQSGRLYGVDATNGTIYPVALTGADAVQAGISIQIRLYSNAAFAAAYSGTYDVVIATTSNTTGSFTTNNKVIALRTDTGAVLWTFNPCSPSCTQNVDQIIGEPWVDYARNRIYVTTRAGASGNQQSLWVLNSLSGAVVTSFALGHISTAPTQSWDGNTLWVGNENGDLYAINLAPATPVLKWTGPLALGSAARLKGFVWEDWISGRLLFSTANGTVRCFQDPGAGATPSAAAVCSGWGTVSTAVAGATTGALLDNLYVGSWNGTVGQVVAIDPATGVAGTPFMVGDGTRQVGDMSTETGGEIFVGTTEGKVFKITLPLP